MRLALSNIGFAAQDDEKVYALLREYGFAGLEAAPTRLVGEKPYAPENLARAKEKAALLRERFGLCIPSLQSIWYGQTGNLFCEADAPRLAAYTDAAAAFAAAVGCPSMVFGCPRQRNIPEGGRSEDARGFFETVAAAARRRGTAVALEANAAVYGTNFCNTSAEAFAFAKTVPGLAVNYDLGTALTNGEDFAALRENLALVSHVHISEPGLAPIEQRGQHRELAALLRDGGYARFVSIEMKTADFDTVRRCVDYVAEVFR